MTADLEPYPAYKESELRWLDRVPSHWDVLRAKCLFREIDERSSTGKEDLLSVSHITGVTKRSETNATMFLAKSNKGHKICRPGDLVINTMWAWMGALGVSPQTGLVSPSYGTYRPIGRNALMSGYAHKLLRTPQYVSEYVSRSTGIHSSRLRLYPDKFLRIPVLCPPSEEQAAIVRFLNHATRRIADAIREKKKLIALLNEQKQTIIHRVVTRGLDPNIRLRPSSLSWLGDIPEQWEMLSLKRVLKRLIDCEHKTAPAVEQSDFRVVRTTGIRYGKLRLSGTYCTSAKSFRDWTRRGLPEVGDVMFTREAPAGEACVMPHGMNLCLGQRTVLMKPVKERLDPQYLVHMIYAGPPRVSITLASQGSTVGHFNMSDIGSMAILLPPLDEQVAIVAAIRERTANIDTGVDRAEREIGLLRAYATRLTADVVTGQVDARGVAQYLPEVVEEVIPEAQEVVDEEEAEGLLEAVTDDE